MSTAFPMQNYALEILYANNLSTKAQKEYQNFIVRLENLTQGLLNYELYKVFTNYYVIQKNDAGA